MDFWGDAGQVCAAIGGAAGGIATVFVAAFGKKLWKATDALTEQTRLLAVQTARANDIEEQAAAAVLHDRRRPKLGVAIFIPVGNFQAGELLIRHRHESETELIGTISVEIHSAADDGEVDVGREIVGPWRFKQGVDNADEFGRTVVARGPLPRGVVTRWALAKQAGTNPPGMFGWGSPNDGRPCLISITAAIGDEEWRYSALLTPAKELEL
ncbi:hypothetical protein KDL01_29095 [Actinospica durhamensis]|uniref:Uncharacterized protein n=1 Tax=Actinospica durhamensis TaxID=1508375 RepID=A0A941IVK4_9ACTN|nr:hypothetical protein [Actinospica durhamensis]MBR7837371.1 hypothetical protein [Actinospica durhamensis]